MWRKHEAVSWFEEALALAPGDVEAPHSVSSKTSASNCETPSPQQSTPVSSRLPKTHSIFVCWPRKELSD